MTREEYMQKVEKALQGYDRGFAQELIDNYNEHFETALKEGRSEEEICQELGAVEGLLKDIVEFMGDKDISAHEIEKFTAVAVNEKAYSGVTKIEMDLSSRDVRVIPSSDNQLHVYMDDGSDKAKHLEERLSGDSYYARQLKKNQTGNLLERILRNLNEEEGRIIIEAPKELDSLIIKTMSGDIEVEEIFIKAVKLETMSGDVELREVKAEESFIKTMSGDINLEQADGKEIVVHSTSGEVDLDSVGAEEIKIKTISGDVDLSGLNCNVASINSTSGDINFRNSEAGKLEVGSVSGDINGVVYADRIKAHTTSGDIRLTLDRRGKLLAAKGKAVSGDCNIYGADQCYGEPDPSRYIIAEFSTISGDVKIK